MDTISLPSREMVLGDIKTIGVKNLRSASGASLNGTVGQVDIYNSAGSAILSAVPLAVTYDVPKTRAKASYQLVTGLTGLTSTGTYRAVYMLTFPDGSIYSWEQDIIVKARPF